MSDRELLELAAKAAGIKIDEHGAYTEIEVIKPSGSIGLGRIGWDALRDDGDALRLAVKLYLPISSEKYTNATWICKGDLQVFEMHNGSPDSATRRAIVRAAAEIGKSL